MLIDAAAAGTTSTDIDISIRDASMMPIFVVAAQRARRDARRALSAPFTTRL
jgi:hypothetical protein